MLSGLRGYKSSSKVYAASSTPHGSVTIPDTRTSTTAKIRMKTIQASITDGRIHKIGLKYAEQELLRIIKEDAIEFSAENLPLFNRKFDNKERMKKVAQNNNGFVEIVLKSIRNKKLRLFAHDGKPRQIMDTLNAIGLVILILYIPFDLGFDPIGYSRPFVLFGYVTDIIFVGNICMNFRTPYYDYSTLTYESDTKKIAKEYLKLWFWIDTISTIPFEIFLSFGSFDTRWLKASKWGKLPRLLRLANISRYDMRAAHYWRMVRVGGTWLVCVHWIACTLSHELADFEEIEWISENVGEIYIWAFTASIKCMLGLASPGVRPDASWIILLVLLVGYPITFWLQGHIFANVLIKMQHKSKFYDKVSTVNHELEQFQISKQLRTRVLKSYSTLWKNQKNLVEGIVYKDPQLSHQLRMEVALASHNVLISKASLFLDCNDACIGEFLLIMQTHMYLPDDYIVYRGDPARALYILNKGICRVLDPFDDVTVRMHVLPGQSFGEIGVISSRNTTRRCSVVADGLSEIHCVTRDDFIRLINSYPQLRQNTYQLAYQRAQIDSNKLSEYQELHPSIHLPRMHEENEESLSDEEDSHVFEMYTQQPGVEGARKETITFMKRKTSILESVKSTEEEEVTLSSVLENINLLATRLSSSHVDDDTEAHLAHMWEARQNLQEVVVKLDAMLATL